MNRDDLLTAVGTLTSENGRVLVDVDGLLIVGDRVEVLRRVEELIQEIQNAEVRTWVVQLYVVGLTRRAVDDIGIDFAPALDLAVTFATATDPVAIFNLNAALTALLDYEKSSGEVATLAAPTFVVRDGNEAHTFVGEIIPIAKKNVGQNGDVTTVDYEEVEIGLDILVKVREVGDRRALISVAIDRSRISGFVGDIPRSTTEKFSTTAVVNSNGVYLLGELQRADFESTVGGRFKLGSREVDQWDTVQIWLRTHAIDQQVISHQSVQRKASPAAMSEKEISGDSRSNNRSKGLGASVPIRTLTPVTGEPGPMPIERSNITGTTNTLRIDRTPQPAMSVYDAPQWRAKKGY